MMEIITEKIAKNHTHNHLIFFEINDPSTLASYVLLKDYYRDLDITVNDEKDWRYLFIAKRTFLRHQRKNGKWICHYCGNEIFEMSDRNKRYQKNIKKCVTVDHKEPKCECNDKTDSNNFLVCCYRCNGLKGSKDYETFVKQKPWLILKEG
jgi:hypothetical protein